MAVRAKTFSAVEQKQRLLERRVGIGVVKTWPRADADDNYCSALGNIDNLPKGPQARRSRYTQPRTHLSPEHRVSFNTPRMELFRNPSMT